MAAKRGRRHGPKKGKKTLGGSKLLVSMKKQLTRIENKVNPNRKLRKAALRDAAMMEAELASKYS